VVIFMLVLSAVAVVVAAVLLVVWLIVQDGFTLVFASMGSAAASIVLLWAARQLSHRSDASRRGTAESDRAAGGQADADHAPPRPVAAPVGQTGGTNREPGRFPIQGYDTLWVAQIVDAVAGLDQADLAAVESREREGRRRPAVLDAVAARRGVSSDGSRADDHPGNDPERPIAPAKGAP